MHALKRLKSAPEGIVSLFFIQMFSTLGFSVLYATLVLYMTKQLSIPPSVSNSVTGVFVAFNFALHLLGGYWGGRLFSNRALFCIGMFSQMVGCILLSTLNESLLYFGLAFFLTGSGLNVTCINCMITQRFAPDDTRRETAFLFNYAGMNVGFFAGFTLSGYFQLSMNYRPLFLFSSLGNVVAVVICLYSWKLLADKHTVYSTKTTSEKRKANQIGFAFLACLPFILTYLLHVSDVANGLVLITGACMLFVAYVIATQQSAVDAREKIHAFMVFMLVSTLFWTLYQIGPMGLTHFIENNVDRNTAFVHIPPQWFQNINTLIIVLGGPLLSWLFNYLRSKGVNIHTPAQFGLALFLIGLAFCVLPLGIANANAQGLSAPVWVVLCYVLQSIGELLLSPIGYAMVGALAPARHQGVMMGMWMLCGGVGATLSSYSSNWMTSGLDSVDPLVTNASYSHVFMVLGLAAIAGSILLYALSTTLKAWIQIPDSTKHPEQGLPVS